MIDSDTNRQNEVQVAGCDKVHELLSAGQIAGFNKPHERLSTGSVSTTGQLPDSPTGPPKAPVSKFKMILAQLLDEFDQVSTMLDKEIRHRVHLEAKVACITAEVEGTQVACIDADLKSPAPIDEPAEMAACGESEWRVKKNKLNYDLELMVADIDNPIVLQNPQEDALKDKGAVLRQSPTMTSTKSGHSELNHKKIKDQTLEDLEMIKGWKDYVEDMAQSTRSIREHVGIVRSRALQIVQTPAFDAICSIFIIYNATLLGAAADYTAKNFSDPQNPPTFYRVSDRVCTVWFLVELIVRLSSEGIFNFFMGPLWTWNLFDFIVVASDVLLTLIDIAATDMQLDFSFLRMLRVLRVTRTIRVVRLVRFFKELRMMVFSVLRSGTSLLWSLILFGIIHYIFGIFLLQQVNDYLWDKHAGDFTSASTEVTAGLDNFQKYWGSLPSCLYTMYACMSGGVSWKDVADDLRAINWFNGVVLGFFIFFCTVVVMNIITGIFVDTAIQSAQSDRDEIIQEQIHSQKSELARLKQAFLEADEDGSATITLPEFQHHLQDPHVRAHLASIGLEVHEAMGLFKLLDMDGSGQVGIEEFVIGCMRLKGNAKSIDLATLMYENKRMVDQHTIFQEFCESKFDEILRATESLRSDINIPMSATTGENLRLV